MAAVDEKRAAQSTLGPWRLIRKANQHQQFVIATPKGNYIPVWDSSASIGWDEHNANGILQAAAPDLAEALETVPWPEPEQHSEAFTAWLDKTRAALRKAGRGTEGQ